MSNLYNEAKLKWGASMPKQIKRLQNRDDDHVAQALYDILADVFSSTWTLDAKIAWALLNDHPIE